MGKAEININFIGSGNVATHLAIVLAKAGYSIGSVFSQKRENAVVFANKFDCKIIESLKKIPPATLNIISVPDDKVEEVCRKIPDNNSLFVHTSGFTGMDALKSKKRFGVFYPLQTFSKEKDIDFSDVPMCIEALNSDDEKFLTQLAGKISENVSLVNSEQRKNLHLTAVMVSNFSNHLYHMADEILSLKNLNFNYLKPLIRETALKVQSVHPGQAQTGPARRNDLNTINEHLQMLSNTPEYQQVYKLISEQIRKKYHE